MKLKNKLIYALVPLLGLIGLFYFRGASNMSDVKKDLKGKLTDLQYKVTMEGYTEEPFKNEYWDNHKLGLYVDVISGKPLFSSLDKYDSGTGWPSFTKPLKEEMINTKTDLKLGVERTEILSSDSGAHLGHVFDDGPRAQGGKRFCTNSASLKFIAYEDLEKEGYADHMKTTFKNIETAVVAGGCFWGVEELLRVFPGVVETEVGYAGGDDQFKTYLEVKLGNTGHAEAVRVYFDNTKTNLKNIYKHFFRLHDPTTLNQQGNDIGSQYRSVIFYFNEEQKQAAQEVIDQINKSGIWDKPIVTELSPYKNFYTAEEYHQDYLQKNPGGYTCHFLRDQ